MAKLTEKMLFETWLDISYSNDLNNDHVNDLKIELNIARKNERKSAKLLKAASGHYERVYGKAPTRPKK